MLGEEIRRGHCFCLATHLGFAHSAPGIQIVSFYSEWPIVQGTRAPTTHDKPEVL